MKKPGTKRKKLTILFFLLTGTSVVCAQGSLTGMWKYTFSGGEMTMQINSQTIVIDGESFSYKTEKNNLQVYDEGSYTVYPYRLSNNQLTLGFPDGSEIIFTRDAGSSPVTDRFTQSLQKSGTTKSPGTQSSSLTGMWLYRSQEGELVLEFLPGNQLTLNGEPTQYQLQEGMIQTKGDYGWINYPYTISQDKLIITFPDGSQIPFSRSSSSVTNQQIIQKQSSGGGLAGHLRGTLCSWSGSSGSSSSYSSSEKITFDGKGNFTFGKESSFSGDAGIAYSGNPNVERGTYRVEEKVVILQFQSGESYKVEIVMRQDDGRITELQYQGKLYATSLCDQ